MKKLLCILFLLFLAGSLGAQTIRLQAGVSVSNSPIEASYLLETEYETYDFKYTAFLGIDYLESTYLNLATNLGFIQKGGRETVEYVTLENPDKAMGEYTHRLEPDYVSLNTLMEFKYPLNSVIPFISVGPRVDFFIGGENNGLFNDVVGGFLLGGGVKYDLPEAVMGLRGDYYLNITKTGEWHPGRRTYGEISDNTFSFSYFIGYKL